MIGDLSPYPAYRDSGVSQLKEIPDHWEIRRLKHLCRLAYGEALAAESRQDGPVEVFGSNGCVGYHSSANTNAPCVVVGRKGSFGKVNYSRAPVFAIDTTFFVDSRLSSADLRWIYFLLGTLHLDEVSKDSAVPGLEREDAYRALAAVPPFPEQRAIARFLDHADRQIRRVVNTKEKLIGALNELEQAIIHRAVSRGLDPTISPGHSADKEPDQPPVHWRSVTLRAVAESIQTGPFGSQLHQSEYVTGGVPVVNPAHLANGCIEASPNVTVTDEKARQLKEHRLRPGDVVMARRGEMGRCAVVTEENADWLCGTGSIRIRPDASFLMAPYLVSVLGSVAGRRTLTEVAIGTTMNNLSARAVGSVRLALPPIGEQRAIADYLNKERTALDEARCRIREQIERMNEYRTRLIADVVTGRLDVREATATLPDTVPA